MVETATFALGCFWDPDARFGALDGVLITRVGYCGGTHPPAPTYKSIGDHSESVQIDFDPKRISYSQLLSYFDRWHVPNTSTTRAQYAAAIFCHTDDQRRQVKELGIDNVRVETFDQFHKAEEYHQKYNFKRAINGSHLFGPENKWTDKDEQMLTKLNGFLAGYGTKEQFQHWSARRELTREQQEYIQNRLH